MASMGIQVSIPDRVLGFLQVEKIDRFKVFYLDVSIPDRVLGFL